MKKNIVLIGFMGVGKSAVSRNLATKINYVFKDMDYEIKKRENMEVSEIFQEKGEEYFRKIELEVAKDFSKLTEHIISTGGGVVKNPILMECLKKTGLIVFLDGSAETIYSHVKNDNKRPLLQVPDKLKVIKDILAERLPLYEKYAEIKISTDNLCIEEISDLIINEIKER